MFLVQKPIPAIALVDRPVANWFVVGLDVAVALVAVEVGSFAHSAANKDMMTTSLDWY